MFDFVRKHTRVMQFLLFLLIFPSFVLFGLEGYNRFHEGGATVAAVDGHDITQAEWDAAHRSQVERMRSSMPAVDVKLFDSPEAKYSTLDRLVRDRLLQAAATKLRLGASDARLAAELQQNPSIAALRRADGTLDIERYRQLLATQGMSPESFEMQARSDLASRQVMSSVGGTSFSSAALADVTLNAFYEQRQVQVARFTPADFVAQIKPSDGALEAYYKTNVDKFQSAERADIEYVVLDLATVQKSIVVPETELKSYYQQNAARLASLEERRASHILINVDRTASAEQREAARAKAQALLAEIQKLPAQFSELARKNSQDTGSATKGGDLDFFGRGAMVKPFEDVAFALKKGETSGIVETEFGFHIIRLTDVKVPDQKSFESQRTRLEQEVRGQLAQRKFAEAAEQFTNIVYEQSDSLKPAAERLKLEVQHASNLNREAVAGNTAANNPKLLAAVFSPDSIEKKRNTEAVELGPNVLAAARITRYSPARTLPLEEVKSRVREQVVAQQAADRAHAEGVAKLAEWKAHPDAVKLPASVVLSRESRQTQNPVLVEAALRASTQTLPAWVGVDLGASGYAVVKIEKVLPRDAASNASNASGVAREREQYTQWWASAEGLAYYKLLKEKFKVEIKVARL
ncbi:SurA N-terminal domain-containing protein [Limnohabitans sp.]|uniref:SurA N-terminal domain-containing protein n=1 Tax=Limnohabitans sp. TaxID=1907725 RepID=UPI00286F8CCA|nr:SurA N-terminal domain-containing protein [Limnohabitans sp.]